MAGWSEVNVAGHVVDLFEPRQRHPHGFGLVYLHGVHQQRLADYPAFRPLLEEHGLVVAAPRTGRSWWTDRICPDFDPQTTAEQFLLEQTLPWIAHRWGVKPPQLGLFGTSMGGQGALRIAYKYPERFPVVAAIAPAIDFQIRWEEGDPVLAQMYVDAEAARQDTATLYIHPLHWPRHQFFCCDPRDERWIESAERLQMKLASLGVPHTCDLETSEGGHGARYYAAMAERTMCFLVESLERERLRLV